MLAYLFTLGKFIFEWFNVDKSNLKKFDYLSLVYFVMLKYNCFKTILKTKRKPIKAKSI